MYIGALKASEPRFFYANTSNPCAPETDNSGYVWKWGNLFDRAVDVIYSFEKDCYVGSVELGIRGAGEVNLFVDGVRVAVKDAAKPIHVNLCGSELTVRIRGNMQDLHFSGAEIFGFYLDDNEPFLIPMPKKLEYSGERVKIGAVSASSVEGMLVADFLTESLAERYEALPDGNGIPLFFNLAPDYENERYTVTVTDTEATVTASTRLALMWGACKILDLWDGATLPKVSIDDKPDVPMRGFHMGLPERAHFGFFKKLIRYVLLPLGYNHVILEFNGDMRYERHPEITEKWLEAEKLHRDGKGKRVMHADIGAEGTALEKSEVRELVEAIEAYGIEVVPEVQSLSHIEYITNAYPELAELGKYFTERQTQSENKAADTDYVPEIPDADLSGIQHTNIPEHCYCPSDERCMNLILDIIDEVVEVVRPRRYVHIGHDEVYHVGLCAECREKGGPRVYIEHVQRLYDHLKSKGLGTMLWSDMLHTDMYYTGADYSIVKESLPKDLILLDFTWYYHFSKDIEDEILPAGFENIVMGNFYSSHYPRFSERIAKHGMVGGEVSTWTGVSEYLFALNGKFFDLPFAAEMLWNAYGYDERNRASLTALIGQCIIPEVRALMHGRYDLYLATDTDTAEIIGTFPGDDSRVPEEITYLGLNEPEGELKIGRKYDRLIFEHTTLNPAPRICWQPLVPVGKYTVTYADGITEDIPVEYAGGILYFGSHFGLPMPQQYYRHQGYIGTWFADPTYENYTAEGNTVLLLGQTWDNPRPDVKIKSVRYTPDENDTAVLLSGGVLGVKI